MAGRTWQAPLVELASTSAVRLRFARATSDCWGFAACLSWLTRTLCTLLRIPTTRLQAYSAWSDNLVDCLCRESERDLLERHKCIVVFAAMSQRSLPKRLACLACGYLFAEARLLFDHHEEISQEFNAAGDALRQALAQARVQALSMEVASRSLLRAPEMIGARAQLITAQTRTILMLLRRINADAITNHPRQGLRRSAERLLLQLAVRLLSSGPDKGGGETLTPTAVIRWMRAAETASGRHPRELAALYKIYKDDKPKQFSRLLSEHLRRAPSRD